MCNPYSNQLNFKKIDFDKIPSGTHGIYGIWFGRRCIYIGKAEDQPIRTRLEQHWTKAENAEFQTWINAKGSALKFTYLVISEKSNIDSMERLFIRKFQPLTNKIRYKQET